MTSSSGQMALAKTQQQRTIKKTVAGIRRGKPESPVKGTTSPTTSTKHSDGKKSGSQRTASQASFDEDAYAMESASSEEVESDSDDDDYSVRKRRFKSQDKKVIKKVSSTLADQK